MPSSDSIDSIVQQLRGLFPDAEFSRELEHNMRAVIQSQLRKMELVTREEFDAQVAVLERSREKIDQLEQQLAELMDQPAP